MSWSLQLQNGDLALSGGQFATVTDSAKLVQDLTCDILEPMGTDDAHPTYGSLIDGGIQNGTYQEGVIGQPNTSIAATFVSSEISRICSDYQKSQIARNAADATTYGKPTLTPGETLISVSDITLQQSQESILVGVTLKTGTGTISNNITVGS
jgi:hypothetical protein